MKKHLLALAVLTVVLMSSCSFSQKVEMDNPTPETITVTIDGKKEYTLSPMEMIEIEGLKKGSHTMQVAGGSELKFELKGRSLLNPTLSTYVLMEEEYAIGGNITLDEEEYVTLDINGEEYWGRNLEVVENAPCITIDDVNFGVLSPFKDEINTSKSGTVIMKKIFRLDDFLKYYKEEYMD